MAAVISSPSTTVLTNANGEVTVHVQYNTTYALTKESEPDLAPLATYELFIWVDGQTPKRFPVTFSDADRVQPAKFNVHVVAGQFTDHVAYCELKRNGETYGEDNQPFQAKPGSIFGDESPVPPVPAAAAAAGTGGAGEAGGEEARDGGGFAREVARAAAAAAAAAVHSGLRPVVFSRRWDPQLPDSRPLVGIVVQVVYTDLSSGETKVKFTAIPTLFGDYLSAVFPAEARLPGRMYQFILLFPMGECLLVDGPPVR